MDRRKFLKTGAAAIALGSAVQAVPFLAAKASAADAFSALDGMGQAALVRSGEVSALELVDAAIKRIEKLNPILNAVVHKTYDTARAAASGPLPDGPFAGVPYLIKDLADMAGAPTEHGSRLFEGNIADSDMGSVERARAAGLVFVGKTNTPEFGLTATTESELTGAARNPWNPAYHTGGSSGGAAGATASGMVPFAHASDGGGSIRIPASVCGLVGLKPSRQRLYVNQPVESPDLSVRLAVTRSVRDTAQILNVTENKGAAPIEPVGFVAGPSKRRLKIAFSTTSMLGKPADQDVRAAIEKTAQLCADLGHEVENVEAPVPQAEFASHFMNVWASMADGVVQAAWMIGLQQGRFVSAKDVLEPWTLNLSTFYRENLAKDDQLMSKSLAGFQRLAQDYARYFETYDVQLTPTLRRPPVLIGALDTSDSFEQHYEDVLDYVGYTPQHNAAGIPAITLPLFTSRQGLPIGSMFGAKYGDERTLLELAYELEEAAPWADRWPEISDQNI